MNLAKLNDRLKDLQRRGMKITYFRFKGQPEKLKKIFFFQVEPRRIFFFCLQNANKQSYMAEDNVSLWFQLFLPIWKKIKYSSLLKTKPCLGMKAETSHLKKNTQVKHFVCISVF